MEDDDFTVEMTCAHGHRFTAPIWVLRGLGRMQDPCEEAARAREAAEQERHIAKFRKSMWREELREKIRALRSPRAWQWKT